MKVYFSLFMNINGYSYTFIHDKRVFSHNVRYLKQSRMLHIVYSTSIDNNTGIHICL